MTPGREPHSRGGGTTDGPESDGGPTDKATAAAHKAAGQAVGKGINAAAASATGLPPEAVEQLKKRIAGSALGRKLVNAAPGSKSFKDGVLGQDSGGGTEKQAGSSGSGMLSGRLSKRTLALGLPLLALLGVLLLLLALLAPGSLDGTQTQPTASSDAKVGKYLPDGWQALLKSAAATTSGEPDFANVPWTVLAGIVQTQTDFARYSPYDNIDRDPGRTADEVSPGGSAPGGSAPGDTTVGVTSGAGPGPIQGVSGSGESTSVSPDHAGPPPGDFSHQLGWFMYALRMHESGGVYTAQNPNPQSHACGAYQYIASTWANAYGYPNACIAPPSVQDKKALSDIVGAWNSYHTWQQVAASWLGGPTWANTPQQWNQCPALCSEPNGNGAIWVYVDDVMRRMRDAAISYPAGTTAPARFDGSPSVSPGARVDDISGTGTGVFADGCPVANASPDIGGKGTQGTGPFLLTPAAAADMRNQGTDPNNPCDAARYVARKLADGARNVFNSPVPQSVAQTTSTGLSTTDYPWAGLAMPGGDQWGMGYGQCVSFVAWMIYKNNGGTQHPSHPGIRGWFPSDGLKKSPVTEDWGNAGEWAASAAKAGFAVNDTPRVGSIAQWLPGTLSAASTVGHVAYVSAVYSDGSIDLAQYNFWADSTYSTAHLPRGGGWDASNGHSQVFVKWPDHFLHIHDDRIPQSVQGATSGAPKATGTADSEAGMTGRHLWVPNGNATAMANARRYWSLVIDVADIFTDRSYTPGRPCALPPADAKKPWSPSFKIIYIWRCEIDRMPDLYLVTDEQNTGQKFTYTVQSDRYAAAQTLVSEALSVSYGAGKWKTTCDTKATTRQGIFPMTKQEANAAGVTDRCDQEQNIDKTARFVLSVEKFPPDQRAHTLGPYQPMVGGWQQLSIAMGQDLETFAKLGPGDSFIASNACTAVMTKYLTSMAPYASAFATLKKPPIGQDRVWSERLSALNTAHHLDPPFSDPACRTGSWASGYESALAQVATGLAGTNANGANLTGLGNYFQAAEAASQTADPVVGRDPLVIPRLASYSLKPVSAPIAPDAGDVWSELGNSDGVSTPLDQLAVEYAWFYGGVIAPFNSAGERIGSLAGGGTTSGGTVQASIGPDGCPETAPPNTLLYGADKIGIHKLCVDSVAKARTPQAAMAIKWALSSLGWPYTQNIPARDTGRSADCSSFVSRAYHDGVDAAHPGAIPNLFKGNAPTTDVLRAVPWTHQIPFSQVQPGDLVEPESGHVVMHLADGYNVQESHTGEVSHVLPEYSSAYWAGWVDASKV